MIFLLFLWLQTQTAPRTDFIEDKAIARLIFAKVNLERKKRGLDTLLWNTQLEQATYIHARQMAAYNFFAHYNKFSKEYYSPSDRMRAVKYPFKINGETNGTQTHSMFDQPTPKSIADKNVDAWMNSSIHKKIILTPEYKEAAVSVVFILRDKGALQYYIVQNYGAR